MSHSLSTRKQKHNELASRWRQLVVVSHKEIKNYQQFLSPFDGKRKIKNSVAKWFWPSSQHWRNFFCVAEANFHPLVQSRKANLLSRTGDGLCYKYFWEVFEKLQISVGLELVCKSIERVVKKIQVFFYAGLRICSCRHFIQRYFIKSSIQQNLSMNITDEPTLSHLIYAWIAFFCYRIMNLKPQFFLSNLELNWVQEQSPPKTFWWCIAQTK